MKYRFMTLDVFTTQRLAGNPLAVVFGADDLEDAVMQKIAREFNLSETTFVCAASKADCTADVRIFTPVYEMPIPPWARLSPWRFRMRPMAILTAKLPST